MSELWHRSATDAPTIYPRAAHSISRQYISPGALRVLYGLRDAGHRACLVGGAVRDLLLGGRPKDFDVATDATPEQVRSIFRSSRLIGRRFRIAHVRFGAEVIEVTTFRGGGAEDDGEDGLERDAAGRILCDNSFGSIEEDARRRDFTVNALYYDIADFSVRDYVGGMADLAQRRLRLIGDPLLRYREDPVRMLRAARLMAKLGFELDPDSAAPIPSLRPLLAGIPPARLFDEMQKLFLTGHGAASWACLERLDLLDALLPGVRGQTELDAAGEARLALVREALLDTDRRVAEGKPVAPGFLLAVIGYVMLGPNRLDDVAAQERVFARLGQRIALPRRFSGQAREIWMLQPALCRFGVGRARRVLRHPRFRAGYDFLQLRARVEAEAAAWAERWTRVQADANALEREFDLRSAALAPSADGAGETRRRRRRGGRRGRGGRPAAAPVLPAPELG